MEFVFAGNKLQRCRIALLNRVTGAQNILIAGEGNGRFLVECRHRFPVARITVVDASACMLKAAHNRLAAAGTDADSVEFVHSNILTWTPKVREYDLVVTHFFLDCFPAGELARVVDTLARSASRTAAWLLADFQIPARGLRRYRAMAIHSLMYAFFRMATRLPARALVSPDGFLKTHGFVLREKQTSEWGLLRSDLWMR